MGNTADLAMIQKTITDTFHKEGKSQRVITERGGCSRSAVSKHIKCKVDWKEEIWKENVLKQQGCVSCFLLLTSFMEMLISFSSRTWHLHTLPKVPKAGSMTMCYCAWLASKLAWPEPNRESRHQTQQCRWPEDRYQSNLGFITPEQCHRLIASMLRRSDKIYLPFSWFSFFFLMYLYVCMYIYMCVFLLYLYINKYVICLYCIFIIYTIYKIKLNYNFFICIARCCTAFDSFLTL